MKLSKTVIAFAAATLLMSTTSNAQQEPSSETFDITALTCWDVISLPETDALFVTAMLLGYSSAQNEMTETSPADVVAKLEAFDTKCGEDPDMNALEALL